MAHVEDPMPCRRCGDLRFQLAVFRNTGFERGVDPDDDTLIDVKALCVGCGAVAMHFQELANGEFVQKVRV